MASERTATNGARQVVRARKGCRPRHRARTISRVDAKDLLKALRARLRLTQEEMAERGDLDRKEINKIETGKNQVSTIRILKALAVAADASLEDMALYFAGQISLDELWTRIEAKRSSARRSAAAGDPFPNRTEAADIARRGGVAPEAIAAVLADPPPSRDHTTLEWIEIIRLRELQIRRAVRG